MLNSGKFLSFLSEVSSRLRFLPNYMITNLSKILFPFSADQHGSRFIQQKLENCKPEEKAAVFREILPHACKLMTDVFGNYVIQKVCSYLILFLTVSCPSQSIPFIDYLCCLFQFFEYGNSTQRKELADQLMGQIVPLSLQMYGCRVIQKVQRSIHFVWT